MTDPRTHFANEFVAVQDLEGQVSAARFTEGDLCRVIAPVAPIHRGPTAPGLDRQALFGHMIRVLEIRAGRAFARDEVTGHVGYIPEVCLGPWVGATHRVSARQTFLFRAPDFKAPDPLRLSLGAEVTVVAQEGRFSVTDKGFYAVASHLRHRDQPEENPVAVAERLQGTPYLWGGNSADGIDCSGLVSAALSACGLTCPADSDQQEAALGETVSDGTYLPGDLLFWCGHVAMVRDPQTLIHANAHHMAVAYEPITDAIARIKAQGDGEPTRHARLT